MKKLLLALLLVLTMAVGEYQPAQAQSSCTTNCYYAAQVILKNANNTPFTGYADIYVSQGHGWQYNKHFTNGTMDSGYVWAGQVMGSWYGIGFHAYTVGGGTWLGSKILQYRYADPEDLEFPSIVNIKFGSW